MMTIEFSRMMLMLSFPVLAGLGGAGMLISNAQRQEARLAARIAGLSPGARQRATAPAASLIARAAYTGQPSPVVRVLALFGCDHDRREIYPVRWWIVLLATFALGRAAVAVSSGVFGTIAWAAWPVVWIMASHSAFGHWEGKRRDALLKQFPDALAMIVRGVRVGIPVAKAIRLVGREAPEPTGPEFARLADDIAIGTPLDAALRNSAARTGLPEYRFFATALTLQAQTGGGLSDTLETLADVIRKRIALRARGYALTSEARTSTLVLCVMPFLIAAMLLVLNPAYIMVMFTEAIGRKMLGVGVLLLLTAIVVMRRLVRSTLA